MTHKEFIKKISGVYDGFIDETTLTRAIQFWFFSLPKYTKVTSKKYVGNGSFIRLDESILKLKDYLRKPELEANELLFENLPAVFNKKDLSVLADCFIRAKNDIDAILPIMMDALLSDVHATFHGNSALSLRESLRDWYNHLPEQTKRHCFDGGEERLFKIIGKDEKSVSDICYIMTGLAPEDFEEDTPALFAKKLLQHKAVIDVFGTKRDDDSQNTYSILLGGHPIKTFRKAQRVSNTGRTLFSELTAVVSEYGQAVGLGEKRQILIEVLDSIDNPDMEKQHDLLR